MSADLFAEFVDFSQPPRQHTKPNPPTPQTQPQTQPQPQTSSLSSDPFSFLASPTTTTTSTQQNQKWGALTPQPNRGSGQWQGGSQQSPGLNGWTGPGSFTTTPFPTISTQGKEKGEKEEEDDDDGWGDFEVAPNVTQSSRPTLPTSTVPSTAAPAESTIGQNPTPHRTRIVRAPTIDLIANNLLPQSPIVSGQASQHTRAQDPFQQLQQFSAASVPKAPPKKPTTADSNVLFDADDFQQGADDDDDFGEFETVASPAQPPSGFLTNSASKASATTDTKASQLLLGLDLNEPKSPYPHAPRSPSFQARNPFPGLAVATPVETQNPPKDGRGKTPATAWPSMDDMNSAASNDFGDWGAFDDFPDESAKPSAKPAGSDWDWGSVEATQPAKPTKPAQSAKVTKAAPSTTHKPTNATGLTKQTDSTWEWDPGDAKDEAQVDPNMDGPPPINIPPPSVLLSVFPQLFDNANTFLFKPVSGQPFSIKNRILSDPKTVEFLSGHVKLATVAARVIAGRKMRWHRDKFLSQSMSISAAGSKGMKLAGVDKAQTAREDREATDVVSNWKENVGRLRSAVAAANTSMKDSAKQLKIPEISENMPVQTAKMVPTAPKACVVCGLKRNERISKVDYEVEDSFGEWWVDHWGHLDCKRFWLQHENALRQR
ncbi:hypothetical protein F4810DRAFT_547327 [Camillea tinctor]|nr:hypothetical protein F4810DRAFT_547327 [Camillea tinctor]